MWNNIRLWIKLRFQKLVNSIAFYPAFIGFLFLAFSSMMIAFDFSDLGKQIKSQLKWLHLKDASTARSIISAIAAGVISLTVFSFSMVMIVLNQAASQLSNRVLDKLIGNRFQQITLGVYIGTIVYALFLLSTIRDINSGIYIPALSTYVLIFITIFDIFLFIYFLHYITQSVKYDVIIQRISSDTKAALEKNCTLKEKKPEEAFIETVHSIPALDTGLYEGFDKEILINLCDKYNCLIYIPHTQGTFVLKGQPVAKSDKKLPEDVAEEIAKAIHLLTNESIDENYFYGFRQLMEVAIKALSPGINDPATAVVSLRALIDLLSYRACHYPASAMQNNKGQVRIIIKELTFEKIFSTTIFPIWDYGKNDRLIQIELYHMLTQLQAANQKEIIKKLLLDIDKKIQDDGR